MDSNTEVPNIKNQQQSIEYLDKMIYAYLVGFTFLGVSVVGVGVKPEAAADHANDISTSPKHNLGSKPD